MFQQSNNGDVCIALALNNTRAQVQCTKLLSRFVTAMWLPSCFERLAPLCQLLWVLKVYNETTHLGKSSDTVSVTVTSFETVQSPDMEARSVALHPAAKSGFTTG
jgi:hypothetical protein